MITADQKAADEAPIANRTGSGAARLAGLCLAAASAIFVFNVLRHWTYLEDDSLIVFRYALNFHAGHGWVANPGEHVNGCTSFFGLILVTALSGFLTPDAAIVVMKLLGVAAGLIVLWKSQEVARIMLPDAPLPAAFAPLLIAYRTDFSVAMTNGLETPYACMFFVLAVTAIHRAVVSGKTADQWKAMLLFVLAGLSRPELTIIFPTVFLLRSARKEKQDLRLLILYALPFICLGAFNLAYYHSVVPNTYYAKLVDIPTGLVEGGEYIAQYLLCPVAYISGVLSLLCLLAVASRPGKFTEIFLLTIALIVLFLLRTSGDWMVDGRLAMPILPLVVASWLVGLYVAAKKLPDLLKHNSRSVVAATGFSALVLIGGCVVDYVQREQFIHQCSRIRPIWNTLQTSAPLSTWMCGAPDGRRQISDWLAVNASAGECVAMPEMGLIPCLNPRINFIDVEGLTDAAIARMPYPHGPYGAHAEPDWDDVGSPMGRYIESRHPQYVISAFTDGSVIRNPNYVKVIMIKAYVDNSHGKCGFVIYRRKHLPLL